MCVLAGAEMRSRRYVRYPAYHSFGNITQKAQKDSQMWFKDFPEHDPNSIYAEPSVEQIAFSDWAEADIERLKASLSRLTVPQQRAIIAKLSGSVYKNEAPAGNEHTFKNEYPAHESEGQALTEASETDD